MKINNGFLCAILPLLLLTSCSHRTLLNEMQQVQEEYYSEPTHQYDGFEQTLSVVADARRKLFEQVQENLAGFMSDTIVVFEVLDLVSPSFRGCICTNFESFTFILKLPSFEHSFDVKEGNPCYSHAVLENALKNDFEAIAKMRRESEGVITPANLVHVFRIVKNNSGWDVNYFEFVEFPGAPK